VAEADSVKRKTGKFALTRSTHIYVFETERITKSHDVHEHIGREQHATGAPKQRDLPRAMSRNINHIDASSDVQGFTVGQRLVDGDWG
jgi:phosphoribosylaminoimidazole (AIR) synthetase